MFLKNKKPFFLSLMLHFFTGNEAEHDTRGLVIFHSSQENSDRRGGVSAFTSLMCLSDCVCCFYLPALTETTPSRTSFSSLDVLGISLFVFFPFSLLVVSFMCPDIFLSPSPCLCKSDSFDLTLWEGCFREFHTELPDGSEGLKCLCLVAALSSMKNQSPLKGGINLWAWP